MCVCVRACVCTCLDTDVLSVSCARVSGDLIPSRTLGDIKSKHKCPGAILAVPEISNYDLQHGEDVFLVLASDGLWDEVKNAKVMELLQRHTSSAQSANKAITQVCVCVCGAH